MKQLGLGVMMYAQDYDETLPQGGVNTASNVTLTRWYMDVAPYIKNQLIRNCPDSQFPVPTTSDNRTNYGFNSSLIQYTLLPAAPAPSATFSDLVAPAGLVMLGDTAQLDMAKLNANNVDYNNPQTWARYAMNNTDWNMVGPYTWSNMGDSASSAAYRWYRDARGTNSFYRRPVPYHNGGANLAFCDGHAKWMKIEQIIGPMPAGYGKGDPNNLWDNQ